MELYTVDDIRNVTFYQTPRPLVKNMKYREHLSNDAIVLYSLLYDRMELSRQNGWVKNGFVFIVYTRAELSIDLACSIPSVGKYMRQLISCGLVVEERQPDGGANIIYVAKIDDYFEKPRNIDEELKKNSELIHNANARGKKSLGGGVKNLTPNYTDKNNTKSMRQNTLFELGNKIHDSCNPDSGYGENLTRVQRSEKHLEYARATGDWEKMTDQDWTMYFIKRHNEVMKDKLVVDTTYGYQTTVFRDFFLERYKIPRRYACEYIDCFIESYKKSTDVKAEYCKMISFGVFKQLHLMNKLMDTAQRKVKRLIDSYDVKPAPQHDPEWDKYKDEVF